jgi:NADPH2:quinone reductase
LLIADKLPAILSKDVVGFVTQVGDGVTAFQVGDRVMSLGSGAVADSSQSGLQEYALVDVVNCARIPGNISDEEAVRFFAKHHGSAVANFSLQATFPTNVSAAFVALFDVLGLPAPWQDGESRPSSLLIVGGGSNCGKFAVQLAKLAKIQTIVVVGGDETALRKLGATHVIDRHLSEDAVVAKVREAAGNDLSYALDAVNMPDGLGLALRALSDCRPGKVARLLPVGEVEDIRGHELLDVLGLFLYRMPECVAMWERLTGWMAAGAICPTSFSMLEGLDADSVNAALDGYRDGTNRNKPQIRL